MSEVLTAMCSLTWVKHLLSVFFFFLHLSAAGETDMLRPGRWPVTAPSLPVILAAVVLPANEHHFLQAGSCTLPRTVLNRRPFL